MDTFLSHFSSGLRERGWGVELRLERGHWDVGQLIRGDDEMTKMIGERRRVMVVAGGWRRRIYKREIERPCLGGIFVQKSQKNIFLKKLKMSYFSKYASHRGIVSQIAQKNKICIGSWRVSFKIKIISAWLWPNINALSFDKLYFFFGTT